MRSGQFFLHFFCFSSRIIPKLDHMVVSTKICWFVPLLLFYACKTFLCHTASQPETAIRSDDQAPTMRWSLLLNKKMRPGFKPNSFVAKVFPFAKPFPHFAISIEMFINRG